MNWKMLDHDKEARTEAAEVPGGVLVRVITTVQIGHGCSVDVAKGCGVAFVPGAAIVPDKDDPYRARCCLVPGPQGGARS